MGELHLEIIADRLVREFGVEANVGKPQVAYKETITRTGARRGPLHQADRRLGRLRGREARGRAGQAGRGLLVRERAQGPEPPARVRARDRARLRGGARRAARSRAIRSSTSRCGCSTGRRTRSTRRSARSRSPASMAIKDAFEQAGPVLLEPVMAVEVVVPEEFVGGVHGDLVEPARRHHGLRDARQRAGGHRGGAALGRCSAT